MNDMNVLCPSCGCEVPVTEVLQSQLKHNIRQEMQAPITAQKAQLDAREKALEEQQGKINQIEAEFNHRVKAAIDAGKSALANQLKAEAREEFNLELADRDNRLQQTTERLKKLEDSELSMRQRERELAEKAERIQNEVDERLAAERQRLSKEITAKAQETLRSELADRESELSSVKQRLKEREQADANMRQRERELAEKADRIQKEVDERLAEGRERLSKEITARAQETLRLELADRESELSSVKQRLKAQEQAEVDMRRRERELAEKAERIQNEVNQRLAESREKLSQEMLAKAQESIRVEMVELESQLSSAKLKLKESEDIEIAMRQRERELAEKAERIELEAKRQVDAELAKVREDAARLADEKHEMKNAEKDKQIADMRKTIDELKRKSEVTSQQLQGEVQELALEEKLRRAFPMDQIDPVGKGRNGADVGHAVCEPNGNVVGRIVFESKRTQRWNKEWLEKIREDVREANANIAVIVTETMPEGITTIGCIDGVWVCRWDCVIGVASVIRSGLMEVAAAQKAQNNRGTKVELLYDYFASNNFRNRIQGVVEPFQRMQRDLIKEKAATARQWAKREKELHQAVMNMAGMYGDFQGIVGDAVPALESFEPLMLALKDADESVSDDQSDVI